MAESGQISSKHKKQKIFGTLQNFLYLASCCVLFGLGCLLVKVSLPSSPSLPAPSKSWHANQPNFTAVPISESEVPAPPESPPDPLPSQPASIEESVLPATLPSIAEVSEPALDPPNGTPTKDAPKKSLPIPREPPISTQIENRQPGDSSIDSRSGVRASPREPSISVGEFISVKACLNPVSKPTIELAKPKIPSEAIKSFLAGKKVTAIVSIDPSGRATLLRLIIPRGSSLALRDLLRRQISDSVASVLWRPVCDDTQSIAVINFEW